MPRYPIIRGGHCRAFFLPPPLQPAFGSWIDCIIAQKSTDGGMTWNDGGERFKNFKVSESPLVPVSDFFFGDYTNVTAQKGVVRPIWARLHNGELSIWTALVQPDSVVSGTNEWTAPP